jgi:hypothetical protein
MRRLLWLLGIALLTGVLSGCGGGEKDRGKFRDQDKPRSADKDS